MRSIPLHHWAGPAYLAFFILQQLTVFPLEQALLGDSASQVSLLFLPAGAKIVAFYVCRWRAIPSLAVGVLLSFYLFYVPEGTSFITIILVSLGSALALPVMYLIACHGFGLDLFKGWHGGPHWLALLSLVALSALLNGYALSYAWDFAVDAMFLARVAIGDVTGTACLMLLAMFVLRRQRLNAVKSK